MKFESAIVVHYASHSRLYECIAPQRYELFWTIGKNFVRGSRRLRLFSSTILAPHVSKAQNRLGKAPVSADRVAGIASLNEAFLPRLGRLPPSEASLAAITSLNDFGVVQELPTTTPTAMDWMAEPL